MFRKRVIPAIFMLILAVLFAGCSSSPDVNEVLPLNKEVIVSDLLEENLVTIGEDEDLATAASLMIKHKISGIPVLDVNQNLIGLVSKTDVVKAFSDVIPHEHLKMKYKELY